MILIDGKTIAHEVLREAKKLRMLCNTEPKLAIILASDDKASEIYVRLKMETAAEVGVICDLHSFTETTTEELITLIESLNNDKSVHAILVQLPLAENLDTTKIMESIAPTKDADGFLESTVTSFEHGDEKNMPVLVRAIDEVITHTIKTVAHQNVTILANSTIFARPVVSYLEKRDAIVSLSAPTQKIPETTKTADIVITALGRRGVLQDEHIKDGSLIIDIGTSPDEKGVARGDTNISTLDHKSIMVTPVPGGIGPITVASLLKRVIELTLQQTTSV